MKNRIVKGCAVLAAVTFMSITVLEQSAHARAGGGRSMGSRGARSYSQPGGSYGMPGQMRPSMAPAQSPYRQQQSGGFMRSMAGGIMGGLLGGMLFSSLGFAGAGALGGGGFGLIEILLLAGIGYLIFRMVRKKNMPATATAYGAAGYQQGYQGTAAPAAASQPPVLVVNEVETGLGQIRRMDHTFDESRFKDNAMDIFFRVQGAWMNRDLSPVSALLTEEMRQIMQGDVERLLQARQVNRLEQIAVRKVEIAEAWQEMGNDFVCTLLQANLLDYTTEDATGAVVSGSKTEPVKFEEYWTFVRPVGNHPWRLSSIQQKE